MRREAEEMMCGNEDSLQSLFMKTTHMYFGRAYAAGDGCASQTGADASFAGETRGTEPAADLGRDEDHPSNSSGLH